MDQENILSLPLLFVPFLNRNDGTRLQMALSQMRQALPLFAGEKPLVETGYESFFYNFIVVTSQYNGIVVYVDKKFIIILNKDTPKYVEDDLEIVHLSHMMKPVVKVGTEVKIGDKLAELYPNKKEKYILDGANLLTAVKMYKGYNYEDAIVVSYSAAKRLTHYELITKTITLTENQIALSLEDDYYKPFLNKGDLVSPSKPIARIKNANLRGLELFKEEKKYFVDNNGVIVDVKYYINKENVVYREFHKMISDKLEGNVNQYENIVKTIKKNYKYITSKELKKLPEYIDNGIQYYTGCAKRRAYKFKNEVIDAAVEYTIMTLSTTKKGDKFANRHGNKGMQSNTFTVVDDKFMPKTKDGRRVDVVINVMGIPSRMNVGQIFELAAANIVWKVKNDLLKDLEENKDIQTIKQKIKEFYSDIDFTQDKWIINTFHSVVDEINDKEELRIFIENMSFLAPTFESIDIDSLINLQEKYDAPDIQEIWNPFSEQWQKATVGYMFWMKLYHLSREKLAARSIGEYIQKTHQPTSGKKNKGGQRVGEMEIWNFISHGLSDSLREMLYTKSDDLRSKEEVLQQIIETGTANLPKNIESKISNIFKTYLNSVNLDIVEEDN